MKIAILTFNKTTNFGAALQCYALSTYLKQIGNDVSIINLALPGSVAVKPPLYRRLLSKVRKVLLSAFCREKQSSEFDRYPIPNSKYVEIDQKMQHEFDAFQIDKIGNVSRLFTTEKELRENYPKADFYIVGSDQVWNPQITGRNAMLYFFSFLNDEPRMSYAASFGGSEQVSFTERQVKQLPEQLKKFKAISVREGTGVNILRNRFDIKSELVVDPTFLLNMDNYKRLAEESLEEGKGFVFVYKFIINDYWVEIINYVAKELNLKVRNDSEYIQIPNFRYNPYLNIQGWLKLIQTSDFVISDSFHCTVFCILFRKKFLTAPSYANGEGRMLSLLRDVGLEERFCYTTAEVKDKLPLLCEEINYDVVFEKLNLKIENSKSFLQAQLN